MEQRISLITLGVKDLQSARRFYETGLGWTPSPLGEGEVVFFQLWNGLVLSLYPRESLAKDMQVSAEGQGFSGITLAYNAHTRQAVDIVLKAAEQAGGQVLREGHDTAWGGYIGYFTDLDGHVWEVAWNPGFTLTAEGQVYLPE